MKKKNKNRLKPHIFYIVFRSRKNPLRMLVQKLRASKQMEIIFEESHFNWFDMRAGHGYVHLNHIVHE